MTLPGWSVFFLVIALIVLAQSFMHPGVWP